MSELLRTRIDVSCPSCGSTIRVTLGDVKAERTVTCPKGHSVQLRDSGDGIRRADRALDDFKRALKRFGRR